nr:hypothetical protein [Tanacetum cinerariifolium]GEY71428.1 hypothetical protein [Tanacetum cinerariifolium]
LRGSRKLKLGALSLYVGNGQRAAVEAIGSCHLCFLNELVIVLNNCHYASSITRGIISVSRLYDDGYVNRFVDNANSMYAVSNKRAKLNLDSALLWHCRLRYISKKRIEKLQHCGLFNLNDLRAFEKCISCMSGKMARKPYTHQVERAKDLLGLIHTDVCGPFRTVSRQGSSYFVTFTDDFSRYPKETMGYSFYYPPEKKVLVARYAEFLENSLITQQASESLEDLKIIQEEDTHLSIDTSLNHKEDDLEIDKPKSDLIPIRDLSESANYKAALLDPESDKWLNAMNVEMQSMKDNKVWDLVDIPPNGKTVGSKWLFKKKTDVDGAVHTFKARLVAKGFTQTYGVDYEETFSPIADIRAIRILIAIAAYYDYEI